MQVMLEYIFATFGVGQNVKQRGATMIEYALIVALIAIAVVTVASFTGLATNISSVFGSAKDSLATGG